MGKIISVWSLISQTGKTLFLYNLINSLTDKLDRSLNILVCCANLSRGNLMRLFNIDQSELNLEDLVNFKITSGGNINIFEAIARHNNVYFCGSKNTDNNYTARNIKVYEELLDDFKSKFDLVLIDTMAGRDNTLSNMIIKKSDYVINILTQDKEQMANYEFKTEKDFIYVINRFRGIYPNVNDIITDYHLSGQTFTLPQCDSLMEMKNREKLSLYAQHDTVYNIAIQEITNCFLEKLNLKLYVTAISSIKKKGRFKSVILNLLGEAYE